MIHWKARPISWLAVSGLWAMPAPGSRKTYLRILRFFRFSAQYAQGPFDREGVAASIRERLGLQRLSRERIRSESAPQSP